jgi:hypothetical protein
VPPHPEPPRPALAASPAIAAVVALESPPLAPPCPTHAAIRLTCSCYVVWREREQRLSNVYGLDKKTHDREGKGKKRKEKRKGIKKKKKRKRKKERKGKKKEK